MSTKFELKAPVFLVAVPQLVDENFNRSVILLLDYNDEGAMGVVINRATELDLVEFCSSQDMEYRSTRRGYVHSGGPVQRDRAFLIHHSDHVGPETEAISGNTRLSYSLESLRMVSESPPEWLRVFLGYAGWGPGQLGEEITSGAWLVTEFKDDILFDTEVGDVWETCLKEMGIEPIQLIHSGEVH